MTGSQCASSCDSYSVVEMKIGIIKKGIENEKMSFFISSLSFLQVSSTLENLSHPLSESEGIDIRLGGEEDKTTIMMLMKNLVPVRDTCTYHSLAIKTEHQNTCAVHILVLYAGTLANAVIKVCMKFFLSTLFFSSYSSLHLKVQEKPTIMTLI